MPEGDSIHQDRLRLQPILEGEHVVEFWARKLRGHRPRPGMVIEAVRAHGKHLLIDFDSPLTLQIHRGMSGWWQVGDKGATEAFRNNPRLRLVIGTERGIAACFAAPTITTFARSGPASALTPLSNLGPDLRVDPDGVGSVADLAVKRLRARTGDHELLIDVLLNQQVAAGIGNVYKSEVCFHQRLWPFSPVGELSDDQLRDVYAKASRLLWDNSQSAGGPRSTTPHGGSFVYRRHRAPCRRCGASIERSYQGVTARSTYWCPGCQKPGRR